MNTAPYPWQTACWDTLVRSLEDGRMSHGLLICGPAGVGKRSFAHALSARLVCRTHTACGECPPCRWFVAGNHPDWHVLEPEEDKQTIQVEGVRALIADLSLSSLGGGRKVVVIEPADAMTRGAANSLLKTLEEPSGDSVLMLLASRPWRLPATVLSRCQMVALTPPPRSEALAWLAEQSPGQDFGGLLRLTAGAPLAALALAEQGFGEHLDGLTADFGALLGGGADPVSVAARWQKMDPQWCLNWLGRLVCDAIRVRFDLPDGDLAHRFGAKGLPAPLVKIKLNRLFEYLDAVQIAERRLDGPIKAGLVIETLLIPLAAGLAKINPEAETL